MTERAMSFSRISQEFHGRGARREQLRQLVHTTNMSRMEDFQTKFVRQEAWMAEIGRDRDQLSNEMCTSIRSTVEEQRT